MADPFFEKNVPFCWYRPLALKQMAGLAHLPSPALGLLMAFMDSPFRSTKEMILDQLSSSTESLRNGVLLRRCFRRNGTEENPGGPCPTTAAATARTDARRFSRGQFQAEECAICWDMLRDSDASVSFVCFR